MDCKYSGFCKHRDGCIEDDSNPMECWAYMAIEGLVDIEESLMLKIPMKDGEADLFPDEIIYKHTDGTQWKLFLERYFYSDCMKDQLAVRYMSVDKAFMEEDPENGEISEAGDGA